MEALEFSLARKEVPVLMQGTDGDDIHLTLREITGKDRDAFLNVLNSKTRIVDGKPSGLKNFDGIQTALLCKSLFTEAGELVTRKWVDELPASVVSTLFEKAQEISGLVDEDEDEAKND